VAVPPSTAASGASAAQRIATTISGDAGAGSAGGAGLLARRATPSTVRSQTIADCCGTTNTSPSIVVAETSTRRFHAKAIDDRVDRWREVNADGLVWGRCSKSGPDSRSSSALHVKTRRAGSPMEYSGSSTPGGMRHTIADEIFHPTRNLKGVARRSGVGATGRVAARRNIGPAR